MEKTEARRHLEALFGEVNDGLKYLVCSCRDFAGKWFERLEDAEAFALAEAEKHNVYIGVGLRREAPPPGQRGSADTVDGLVGLWVDVDVAGKAHLKKGLPNTPEDARALLYDILPVIPPSVVVHSGHGLQGWWLFSEPWIFADGSDRKKAKAFIDRFASTARAAARKRQFVLDPVWDLARVLRLAGTWNRKGNPPVATRLEVPASGKKVVRYDLEDLEACFVADDPEGIDIAVEPLKLTPDRRPPEDALLALLTNDEKARASWEGKRPDLADQSPSSYDFSLAVFAARYGWSDQDIADLLIARRRKHGQDLKTTRRGTIRIDYYQRTIHAARKAVANERDTKAYESDNEPPLVVDGKPVDDQARARIFEKARGVFGLPIVKFLQNGEEDDARFSFVLADGSRVLLGGGSDLEDQRKIRGRIYPITGKFPKLLKAAAWAKMFEELGAVREIIPNEETGRDGRFAALLYEYLSDKTGAVTAALRSSSQWKQSVPVGDPFIKDGQLFVCVSSIEAYVRSTYARRTDCRELWTILPEWGFVNISVKVRVGGREIARRYWACPIDSLISRRGFTLPLIYQDDTTTGSTPDGGTTTGSSTDSVREGGDEV